MSRVIASPPATAAAVRLRVADHADRPGRLGPSRIWLLVEALAYAGASIDPVSALAARRFARLRDQERW